MGTWTGTPRTWVAGEIPTAAMFNSNLRDFGRAFADAWTAYTPTLTASTTSPTGWTQTGSYMQAGKLVIAKFVVGAGPSMTAGSGVYRIAFPVAATGSYNAIGSVLLYDSSSSNAWTGAQAWHTTSSTYFEIVYAAGGGLTTVAHDKPWANWAANDYIRGTITYEAA